MSKFKQIYLLLLISVAMNIGNIHASAAAAAAATFTAADITAELNADPIVKGGKVVVPYRHNPIPEGLAVFQGDIVVAKTGEKVLLTENL